MSSITMRSGIIRARATFCCSLGIRIFIARDRFSAAKDWVGSCGTIIKRRHKRGDVPQMNFLTIRGLSGLDPHQLVHNGVDMPVRPIVRAWQYRLEALPHADAQV